MPDWSPDLYLRFDDERSRPATDLLTRMPVAQPNSVVDLGCGPGNSTALLRSRYPDAHLTGVDNSPAMIQAAKERLPEATFVEADIGTWAPEGPVDVMFSNAAMQWVPNHIGVLVRLFESLRPGGVLAMQVPDNLDQPTHRLMREVASEGPWSERFADHEPRETIGTANAYYDALGPKARSVDVWHTIYYHVLEGPSAIVEWLKGTGLRPYLNKLDTEEQASYLNVYGQRVAEAHPVLFDNRVILRYPRLFLVAVRG